MTGPTFADIEDAARQISSYAVRTPLLRHDALDERVNGRLFVKAEPLQRTGSFKFRGAYNRISRLSAEQRKGGVVAFSSGNHAQGVAAAAKIVGCPAVIVMPADAPAIKIAMTRSYGADVVLFDRLTEDREAIGAAIASERGAVLVPPYDDPYIIAGQGTIGLEIASQMTEFGLNTDVACTGASGGGLTAGVALSLTALAPGCQIYVAEPAGYDDHGLSLAAGERRRHSASQPTLCDALMAPTPGELTFPINRRLLAGAVSATDDEILDAMGQAFLYLKLVIEPGGAAGLAAALQGRLNLEGRSAVVVASGGNVDPAIYSRALARLA